MENPRGKKKWLIVRMHYIITLVLVSAAIILSVALMLLPDETVVFATCPIYTHEGNLGFIGVTACRHKDSRHPSFHLVSLSFLMLKLTGMTEQFEKKELTKKSKDISQWYNEVILKTELADYGPARGTMVIRPYGYAIWERIKAEFNSQIKKPEIGAQNCYFPLFIPERLLEKEKEHVEGFAPQLAVVTIGGGKKLEEKLIVRPTSETIMYPLFAKWISSWRDLPLKINQWCNIVRWELRTMLFMRTSEFLWQEGHTAHATQLEAKELALKVLDKYQWLYREVLALPFYSGKKSEKEKFAGADTTYAVELLMPDGKALQGATSHELGQNFAKAFKIQFQDKKGKNQYVWQTSWGLSTRSIGALIMAHGDDNGLILPPKVAPIKVVIIPVLGKEDKTVLAFAQKVKQAIEEKKSEFQGKVEIWGTTGKTFGWSINEAELRGIPLVIPVGPKEVKSQRVTINRRDGGNEEISLDKLAEKTEGLLREIQKGLLSKREKFLKENTRDAKDYQEFKEIIKTKRGFVRAFWCEDHKCEEKIKEETKATTRVLSLETKEEKGKCLACGKEAKHRWLFAQAY